MHDPTRIDATLDALRRAWEGQPELSLATLFAMLSNRGLGWGTQDAVLREALEDLARVHPPLVPVDASRALGTWLAVTNTARITLGPSHVIVRTAGAQPVVWEYSGLRPLGPSRPVVIKDAGGVEHRYGVCASLSRLEAPAPEALDGLSRADIGDNVYVIQCADGSTVLLDHGLHHWQPGRRTVERVDYSWERIEKGRQGEDLVVLLPGSRQRGFAPVSAIYLAECQVNEPGLI